MPYWFVDRLVLTIPARKETRLEVDSERDVILRGNVHAALESLQHFDLVLYNGGIIMGCVE